MASSNSSSSFSASNAPVAGGSPIPTGGQQDEVDVSSNLARELPWRGEFSRVNDSLANWSDSMAIAAQKNKAAPVLRVTQLDAQVMDLELFDILKAQFFKSFAFFAPDFKDSWQPELELLLKTLIFAVSIARRNFSYGQQLQNLTFRPLTRTKKMLFIILTAGVPYLLARWFAVYKFVKKHWLGGQRGAIDNQKRERDTDGYDEDDEAEEDDGYGGPSPITLRRLHSIEKFYQLITVLNFLVFLWNGDYISPVHRLLGMKQFYLKSQTARFVGFDYMNRQMMWNGFTDFMLFIVPVVPWKRISRSLKWFANSTLALIKLGPSSDESAERDHPGTHCPICTHSICIPYETSCGHRYCYYCLKVATLSENKPSCIVCSKPITSIRRYQPLNI